MSGEISLVASTLDYETTPSYEVVAQVSNDAPSVTGTLTLTIAVTNVLEALIVSDANGASNTIAVNAPEGAAVRGLSLEVRDEGGRQFEAVWSFASEGSCVGEFIIDPTNGAITLSSEAVLEIDSNCGVIVQAANASIEGILPLTITITEVINAIQLRLKLFLEGPL